MRSVFYDYRCSGKLRNVIGEADSAHELGKPRPHRVAVEFAKQGRVVEPDPSSPAFLDVLGECGDSLWRPTVGRIVQLYEQLVVREKCIVNFVGGLDVIDREVVFDFLLLQPDFCSIDKSPVNPSGLRKRDDVKPRR